MDLPHLNVSHVPTRRAVLAGSGAGAALAVLAACGGDPPSGTQDGTDSSDGASGGAVVEPGQELASTDDVPVGGALAVTVEGAELLVTQPEEGTFAAFSAICTHQGCTVAPGDGELRCPCHASRFDLATGDVLGGPAPEPLHEVSVTVDDGRVTSS
ncbi:Rieske (2Fe-2S) protein [Cellulosimicrobium terreum]|nr:Rieske (2Fe-2S) protein [Cellulosimicrobium terreum]